MFLRLVVSQARHKWYTSLLVFLTLAALVTLYVYTRNTAMFSNRSMQLVMKDMGHNLMIVPKNADLLASHLCAEGQLTFPDSVTRDLANVRRLPSKYYVSVLQQPFSLNGHRYLLTGVEPVDRGDETAEKDNMVAPVQSGQARLGASVAEAEKLANGDSLEIMGRAFTVSEVIPPKGTQDDYRVYIPLAACQEMTGHPGEINMVLAFLCLHAGSMEEGERFLRGELDKLLPEFQLVVKTDIARARYLARLTTSESLHYIIALVLAITVLVIVISGLQEVTERRHETGILVAMGAGYVYIAGLYLAKIAATAVLASLAGFLLGSRLAILFTAPFLVTNTKAVAILWGQFPAVLALTVAVALLSEAIPVIKLVRMDPNQTLTEE